MSSGTTDIIYEYMNGALSKVKTYAENDNGTKNINVYVFTGAGTTIKQYTHTETGFSEKSVYESGAVNRVFTTIPSYK